MFENKTFENILSDALARVADKYDKREGAIIYDAIAPACAELAQVYIDMETLLNMTFADTAAGDWLERRTAEHGITREPATHAIARAEFTPVTVDPIGARFSCGLFNYTVISKVADGVYLLQCDTLGSEPNGETGQLIPIEYVDGLQTAKITQIEKAGEDPESDEHLRARFFEALSDKAYGGNVADYKQKVHAIEGVGGVKITPVWNGGGTVKVTIQASNYDAPTQYLIDEVQRILDPTQDGQGIGIAPIGHVVTVTGAAAVVINVNTTLTYASGWDYAKAKEYIFSTLNSYFLDLRKSWENNETLIVRVAMIESKLLACEGVIDVENTTINGGTTNIQLGAYEVPTMGAFNGTY